MPKIQSRSENVSSCTCGRSHCQNVVFAQRITLDNGQVFALRPSTDGVIQHGSYNVIYREVKGRQGLGDKILGVSFQAAQGHGQSILNTDNPERLNRVAKELYLKSIADTLATVVTDEHDKPFGFIANFIPALTGDPYHYRTEHQYAIFHEVIRVYHETGRIAWDALGPHNFYYDNVRQKAIIRDLGCVARSSDSTLGGRERRNSIVSVKGGVHFSIDCFNRDFSGWLWDIQDDQSRFSNPIRYTAKITELMGVYEKAYGANIARALFQAVGLETQKSISHSLGRDYYQAYYKNFMRIIGQYFNVYLTKNRAADLNGLEDGLYAKKGYIKAELAAFIYPCYPEVLTYVKQDIITITRTLDLVSTAQYETLASGVTGLIDGVLAQFKANNASSLFKKDYAKKITILNKLKALANDIPFNEADLDSAKKIKVFKLAKIYLYAMRFTSSHDSWFKGRFGMSWLCQSATTTYQAKQTEFQRVSDSFNAIGLSLNEHRITHQSAGFKDTDSGLKPNTFMTCSALYTAVLREEKYPAEDGQESALKKALYGR